MKFGKLLGLSVTVLSALVSADKQLENRKLVRSLDLTKSYVRELVAVNVFNSGSTPESEYIVSIPVELADDVAKLDVKEATHEEPLKVSKLAQDENGSHYSVHLPEPIEPGSQIQLQLFVSYVNLLQPLPATIKQNEQQHLSFAGLKTFYSVYPTKSQTTRVKIMAKNTHEINMSEETTPGKEIDGAIQYGPFGPRNPFDVETLMLKYDYPLPLPFVDSLKRDIWISHVSDSISFQEAYNMTNAGAKLEGSFSRSDFMAQHGVPSSASASIIELPFTLPLGSHHVYYTDLVGNVSTSHFRSGQDVALLEMRPRFPVFGGWNYNFTIGWEMPLRGVSRAIGDNSYVVGLPLLNGPIDAQYGLIESNYILPEGAENIEVAPSETPLYQEELVTYSYLDTKGRPTIKIIHSNFVDSHRSGIVFLKYTLPSSAGIIKPTFIATIIGGIFLGLFSLSQLDFSIQ